ncbi:MAG TPA: DEAD/DEAH box helicase [Chthoniobacteraceae bacterium]|nr:DEAD/DEAH box helicase [Chthoniobacteraceae bacterium]
MKGLEINLVLPDAWQHEAVNALRQGRDVVVDAPTGAGKTFIFELMQGSLKGQSVYTVPTRALANDKLSEWRRRGWDVGIATGDLALRLDARIVVATLETQKGRLLRGEGPRLLVVDEYQMLADPVRGVNYELSMALAPPETQLLLLSGSVANAGDVVEWLRRIGRDAVLISHKERPVPLTDIDLLGLPDAGTGRIAGLWPRLIAKALRADLGPVLVFAPRRNAAEELAQALAAALPPDAPLALSPAQEMLAGGRLAKMLNARVAYHHSGMSYALRAGIVEPLAKNGHLRVVVATMGLAAGINFSMRSVVVTDTRYLAGNFEREVQPDELLQMFGRAGRRGLDESGYVLSTPRQPRLHDGRARRLKRVEFVDWPALIAVMRRAAVRGENPFSAAVDFNRRLFTTQPVPLGVEHCLETGPMPCGLSVDAERARYARRGVTEMLNSRGQWEPRPEEAACTLGELWVRDGEHWRRLLQSPAGLEGIGFGNPVKLRAGRDKVYGRELPLATVAGDEAHPVKWLRKLIRKSRMPRASFDAEVLGKLPALTGGGVLHELQTRGALLAARLDYSALPASGFRDSHGAVLRDPPTREDLPAPCRACPELERYCKAAPIVATPAYAWRRLGLIERDGAPTTRGILVSFFNNGEGFAVAAALEDETYAIDDLLFDLANLRAGHRFAQDESPFGGHLGALCQRAYERADYPGYLEMGVPVNYGAGASEVVRDVVERGASKQKLLTESLRPGDIERALVEWRSLVRHIALAPDFPHARWAALKAACARLADPANAGAVPHLPTLLPAQTQRREARKVTVM